MFPDEKQNITYIANALFMPPDFQVQRIHPDRPYHCLAFHKDSAAEYRFSDGLVLNAVPGSLIYLPKSSSYAVRPIRAGDTYAVNFLVETENRYAPFVNRPVNAAAVLSAFSELALQAGDGQGDSYSCRSLLYRILDLLTRELKAERDARGGYLKIRAAVDYMQAHAYRNDFTIAGLAEISGVSEAYFRRIFHECFQMSPAQYLTEFKLRAVETRLLSGRDGLEKIAADCGFYDAAHLCREFRKKYHTTPGAYRRENSL